MRKLYQVLLVISGIVVPLLLLNMYNHLYCAYFGTIGDTHFECVWR